MAETKNSIKSSANHVAIICESNKHWSSYILPVFFLVLGILFILFGLVTSKTFRIILISGIIITSSSIMKILFYKSVKWILTKENLIIKFGVLPWKKTHFEVPIENIYEAYYQFGFWGKILDFGHLNIRRTEGSTTNFKATKMTNHKLLTQTINIEIKKLKKLANQEIYKINTTTDFSVSDELFKLNELYEKSVLTKEEFNQQKSKLLQSN